MLEIIASVSDHEQFVGRQNEAQTERQFRAADPAGKRHDKSFAHRNMSSSAGRTSSDAPLSGPRHANNLQQSWRFDWEPPKAVLRDVWTIVWILGC
jgi:hypothetical protein